MQPLDIELKGLTSGAHDVGTDTFRAASLPLFRAVGADVTFTVTQRAVAPRGVGAARLAVNPLKSFDRPVKWTDEGLVRRVRGVAWTVNMSAQNATAAFSAAKGVLLKLLADVQIFTDVVSARLGPVRSHSLCYVERCPSKKTRPSTLSLNVLLQHSLPQSQ